MLGNNNIFFRRNTIWQKVIQVILRITTQKVQVPIKQARKIPRKIIQQIHKHHLQTVIINF